MEANADDCSKRKTNMFFCLAAFCALWAYSWGGTWIKHSSKYLHTWVLHIYTYSNAWWLGGVLARAHSPTERQSKHWHGCKWYSDKVAEFYILVRCPLCQQRVLALNSSLEQGNQSTYRAGELKGTGLKLCLKILPSSLSPHFLLIWCHAIQSCDFRHRPRVCIRDSGSDEPPSPCLSIKHHDHLLRSSTIFTHTSEYLNCKVCILWMLMTPD